MTKEQFLSAIGDIDDKFIKEITDAPAVLDKPQENYFADEKPQVVYLTNERIPFWKIAALAAAAICILSVGIFAAAKLHGIQFAESGSDVSLSSSDISNSSAPIVHDKSNSVVVVGSGDYFELNFKVFGTYVFTDAAAKYNSFAKCAEVTVNFGADSTRPITFSVWNAPDELNGSQLTETVTVTANNVTAYMPYIDQEGEPEESERFYLHAFSQFDMDIGCLWMP